MISKYQPDIFVKALIPALYRGRKQDAEGRKTVYLTFDDGPCEESTQRILEILRRQEIKATFFCVGENVVRHRGLYSAILAEGHTTGNHTMHHDDGFRIGHKRYIASVALASKEMDTPLFRAPHGKMTPWTNYALRRQGYRIVGWDVIAWDWDSSKTPADVLAIVQRHVRAGSIIVLHDSKKAKARTLAMLEPLILWLKKEGYSISSL